VLAFAIAATIAWTIYAILSHHRSAPPPPTNLHFYDRLKDWAYIAQRKMISNDEELTLIVVPSPAGEGFDQQCLLYKNLSIGTTQLVCPDYAELAERYSYDAPRNLGAN
jgi:hypothetical protein